MKIFSLAFIFTIFCFAVNAQNYTNKINVKKGQVTEVVSSLTQLMNMGMEMTTKTSITKSVKVTEVSESDFKIKVKIIKLKSSGDAGGTSTDYDSEKPDSENNAEMVEAMKDKLNSEEEFSVGRTTLVAKDLTKKDNKEEDPMEAIMEAAGGTESAASEMYFLIPKGKKTGDSWTTNSETKGGKTENTYTLKEVKGELASIDFKTTNSLNLNIPVQEMEMIMNMKMTGTGNFIVNTETGLLKKKTTNGVGEGTIDMMGQSVPISMTTTMEVDYNTK